MRKLERVKKEKDYQVISICKDDLKYVFKDEKRQKQIDVLTNMEMKSFVDHLSDSIFDCGYWDIVESTFEACYPLINKEEEEEEKEKIK